MVVKLKMAAKKHDGDLILNCIEIIPPVALLTMIVHGLTLKGYCCAVLYIN